MRTACERCEASLEPTGSASICTFECTFCAKCAEELDHVCPNCGGELVPRPRAGQPPSTVGSAAHFTVVDLDDCVSVPAYEAELIFLRHSLGVRSFGMQVERLPAHYEAYAEHDERESGQEEIYTLLEGTARLLVGGEEHALRPGVFARVGRATRRKIVTDDEPALLLCLGGRPGQVYEPPAWTDPAQRPS